MSKPKDALIAKLRRRKGPISFQEVPSYIPCTGYSVDVSWSYLLRHVKRAMEDGLELDPDFQRGHVWTEGQRSAYVEFCLRGGSSARHLYFNCYGYTGRDTMGPYVIVDGRQRLSAVLGLLDNKVEVFGHRFEEFMGELRMLRSVMFRWNVNELRTRAEVLEWYLEMNSMGTPHTASELRRVKNLLRKEKG